MAISRPTPPWSSPRRPSAIPRELAEAIASHCAGRDRRRVGRSRRARLHQYPPRSRRFGARRLRADRCAPADFGRAQDRPRRGKVNVEYVSANPTGPMHVGHGRGAVFGDALANLLAFAGCDGDARILHQRRRRAGRCAGALRLSCATARRSARTIDDSRGALSRRLSDAGRRGARRSASATALLGKPESEWLPIVRAARHRRDDGDDPRRSRRA